ncbi:MAG: DUF883 family protein [Gammaproteobacteria bacterium]
MAAQSGTQSAKHPDQEFKELQEELASLKSDMGDIADTLAKLAHNTAEQGRQRVKSAAEHSRAQAQATLGSFEKEIEERPMTSVAVALGIGFFMGKLFNR